jgi:hypothetical protein
MATPANAEPLVKIPNHAVQEDAPLARMLPGVGPVLMPLSVPVAQEPRATGGLTNQNRLENIEHRRLAVKTGVEIPGMEIPARHAMAKDDQKESLLAKTAAVLMLHVSPGMATPGVATPVLSVKGKNDQKENLMVRTDGVAIPGIAIPAHLVMVTLGVTTPEVEIRNRMRIVHGLLVKDLNGQMNHGSAVVQIAKALQNEGLQKKEARVQNVARMPPAILTGKKEKVTEEIATPGMEIPVRLAMVKDGRKESPLAKTAAVAIPAALIVPGIAIHGLEIPEPVMIEIAILVRHAMAKVDPKESLLVKTAGVATLGVATPVLGVSLIQNVAHPDRTIRRAEEIRLVVRSPKKHLLTILKDINLIGIRMNAVHAKTTRNL